MVIWMKSECNMLEKYEVNGKVAVLISPGFGAGWYSWNTEYPQMIFDPAIVKMLEGYPDGCRSEIEKYCEQAYPEAFLGGVDEIGRSHV